MDADGKGIAMADASGAAMIDGIRREYDGVRLGSAAGTALLWLLLLVPWLLGWTMGFIWRCIVWVAAAFVAGWKAGAGDALHRREERRQ